MGKAGRAVVLRPRADRDIDLQFEYLAVEVGLYVARRFLQNLRQTCQTLQENPELGSLRSFDDERLEGLRIWPVKGFRRLLIFYIPSEDAVEIVRILHGARDLEQIFSSR